MLGSFFGSTGTVGDLRMDRGKGYACVPSNHLFSKNFSPTVSRIFIYTESAVGEKNDEGITVENIQGDEHTILTWFFQQT